jgi:hypothetical protein
MSEFQAFVVLNVMDHTGMITIFMLRTVALPHELRTLHWATELHGDHKGNRHGFPSANHSPAVEEWIESDVPFKSEWGDQALWTFRSFESLDGDVCSFVIVSTAILTHQSIVQAGERATHGMMEQILPDAQKVARLTLRRELLRVLNQQRVRSWHDIVTLDKLWFYLNPDHELLCLQADAEVPKRERHTGQSVRVMLTIVCYLAGFHLVNCCCRRTKSNGDHYATDIVVSLAISRETQVGKTDRKLIVHSDDTHPHTGRATLEFLDQNRMKRAPHPPYSPDLAPCDFYLFGSIKRLLADREFADRSDLLQAIMDIFTGSGKAT